ncbi:hypothetical protein ABIE44_003738 [Marmoricola sp. OAE513]|uniref:ERAP1-like C-terminal domain-containing protein n=1 Tax=Marmoricola sp. OAE513 TaxID=2817894 RepID=UPI003393619A
MILDPEVEAWADLTIDPVSAAELPALLPRITDPLLRASVWITLRNGVHHARLDPDAAVDLLCAGIPTEDQDVAIGAIGTWVGDDGEGTRGVVHEKLLAVVRDPQAARERLHAAFLQRAGSAERGSDLQLAAVRASISTASSDEYLEEVLAGAGPGGLVPDADLRWRVLKRRTTLGLADSDDLDRELAAANDAKSQVAHAWCHARLADADAKAWAWQRFTGEAAASNYEVEAIGTGFWGRGQDAVVAPYAERFFDEVAATTAVRTGWGLADGALFFYPITQDDDATLARTEALLGDPDLNPSIRRVLIDAGDEVRCRLRARERYA